MPRTRATTGRAIARAHRGGDGFQDLLVNLKGHKVFDTDVEYTNSSGESGKNADNVKADVYKFLVDVYFKQIPAFTVSGDGNKIDVDDTANKRNFRVTLDTTDVRTGSGSSAEGLAYAQYAVACITERLFDKTVNYVDVKFPTYVSTETKISGADIDALAPAFAARDITLTSSTDTFDVSIPDGGGGGGTLQLKSIAYPRPCRQNQFFMILAFMMLTIQQCIADSKPTDKLVDTLGAALKQLSAD